MLTEMLFRQCKTFLYQGLEEEEESKEELKPGLLIQLNFPKSKAEEKAKGAEYEEILAAIWTWTQDLDKAMKLAKEHPAGELIKTLEERSKIAKNSSPEGRKNEQVKDWQKQSREHLEKMHGKK